MDQNPYKSPDLNESVDPAGPSITPSRQIPFSLKVVSVVFILGGVSAVIEMIVSLTYNHFSINTGVLGLFIGFGLLRLSKGWRTCGLVFTWISLVGIPIIGLIFLSYSGPLDLNVYGQTVGHVPKGVGLVAIAAILVFTVWQYRVLTRPEVRELFGLPTGTTPNNARY